MSRMTEPIIIPTFKAMAPCLIPTFGQVLLKALGVVNCLLPRGIGIQVSPHVLHLKFKVSLTACLRALEKHRPKMAADTIGEGKKRACAKKNCMSSLVQAYIHYHAQSDTLLGHW